jgi:putative hydrolase of the HAD superfamily
MRARSIAKGSRFSAIAYNGRMDNLDEQENEDQTIADLDAARLDAIELRPGMEPLTADEKEAFLRRARAQGRSLTSEEQYALFGPPQETVDRFRRANQESDEQVEEQTAAPLDTRQIDSLAGDFFASEGVETTAPPLIRGIVLDFDETLAVLTTPQEELLARGAREALAYMRSAGMELPDEIAEHLLEARRFAEEKSEDEGDEHLADDALSFLLQFYGFPASRMDPVVLHRAVDIFYAYEMTGWALRPSAKATLKALRESGYRLALMTHYNADRVFQRTVDYLGIRQWFDICISSGAVEYRKPDTRFFQIALDKWGALPYEVVVVGDSLKHDIAGAIETGCLAIHFASDDLRSQTLHDNAEAATTVHPDATITELAALPALVNQWAKA